MDLNEIRLRSVGKVKKSIRKSQSSNGKIERLQDIEEKAEDENNEKKKLVNGKVTTVSTKTSESQAEEPSQFVASDVDADYRNAKKNFVVNVEFDLVSLALFTFAFLTRFYKLSKPGDIVFDELLYGKYVALYLQKIFFFDQNPPLGKQLISAVAGAVGYDGQYNYTQIGATLNRDYPIFWMRFLPALCGSLLSPVIYKLLFEAKLNRWSALIGGLLVIFGKEIFAVILKNNYN